MNPMRFVICLTALLVITVRVQCQKVDTLLEGMLDRKELYKAMLYAKNKERDIAKYGLAEEAIYIHTRLSMIYNVMGKYVLGEKYARKAIQNQPVFRDSIIWADAICNLASAYLLRRNVDTAKYMVNQITDIAERRKDPYLQRASYSYMGSILMNTQREKDAIPFYERALALSVKHQYQRYLSKDLLSLATAYLLTDPEKSSPYLKEAQKVSIAQHDTTSLAMCYSAIALNHLIRNEEDLWQKNISTSLHLALQTNHSPTVLYAYMQMIDFYLKKKDYSSAYRICKKSIEYAQKEEISTFDLYTKQKMYEICKELGKPTEAMQYLEEYVEAKTATIQNDQDAAMNMLKLEHELRENKLSLSNKSLALSNAYKQNLLLLSLNVLFLCFVAGFLFFRRKEKERIKHLYSKEKLVEQWIAEERSLRREVAKNTVFSETDKFQVSALHSEWDEEKNNKTSLFNELILTIEKEKLYLNPELNLKNVISILGTNRNYLNKAIQSSGDGNFKQIINRYRVEEAKNFIRRAVEAGELGGLEQFYTASGFNSETSFYRAFKYFTGLTPKEYAREYAQDIRS